jgi:aspartate aminotransferase
VDPVSLCPDVAPYTVSVDAISKAFAATGLRVGWATGPAEIIKPMGDVVGHVGAWAPRPEQVATAKLLADHATVDTFIEHMRAEAAARLNAVYEGLTALRAEGLPVDAVRPQGAIYVSGRFDLKGKRTPDGRVLENDTDTRQYLLNAAGLAVVPFGAFGSRREEGWFRLSIGVVSVQQIQELMPRLRGALKELK